MESLIIEDTKSTPHIHFNVENGAFTMEGQSYPENVSQFYEPVFTWLKDVLSSLDKPVTFELNIIYLNTSSLKAMLMLFDIIEQFYLNGKEININWYYHPENEMGLEYGEDFMEEVNVPFHIIEKDEELIMSM